MTRLAATRREDFIANLSGEMQGFWSRRFEDYGPLIGPWCGHPRSADKRFELMIDTVLNLCLRRLHCDWSSFLDVNEDDSAIGLILEDGLTTQEIPIVWAPRSLKIGRIKVAFASRNAGDALLIALAEQAADFFHYQKSNDTRRPLGVSLMAPPA